MTVRIAMFALTAALLAGCAGDPQLLNLESSQRGPDEFAILPTKPLQTPETFASLPPPTPGQANRADPTPDADAAVALGGSAAATQPGGGPRDPALISRAGRFGVDPAIRTRLAAEDLEYRRANDGRLLERLFSVNIYFRAYQQQSLDQYRELERFRRAGVRTVSAPPEGSY